jgi:hypothetical protein
MFSEIYALTVKLTAQFAISDRWPAQNVSLFRCRCLRWRRIGSLMLCPRWRIVVVTERPSHGRSSNHRVLHQFGRQERHFGELPLSSLILAAKTKLDGALDTTQECWFQIAASPHENWFINLLVHFSVLWGAVLIPGSSLRQLQSVSGNDWVSGIGS